MTGLKRLFAIYIDLFLSSITVIILKIGNDKIFRNNKILFNINIIIIIIFAFVLILAKDLMFQNQSIGKRLFKLKIFDCDGNEIENKKLLIKRNIISFMTWNISGFTILFKNKSICDYIYKTQIK